MAVGDGNLEESSGRRRTLERMRFMPPFRSQSSRYDWKRFAPQVAVGSAFRAERMIVLADPDRATPDRQSTRSWALGLPSRSSPTFAPVLVSLTRDAADWPEALNPSYRADTDKPWVIVVL